MGAQPQFVGTTRKPQRVEAGEPPRAPVLVLAYHPTLARIGETIPLGRGATEISRLAPSLVADLDAVAGRLEVSPRGLRLRMTQLGL